MDALGLRFRDDGIERFAVTGRVVDVKPVFGKAVLRWESVGRDIDSRDGVTGPIRDMIFWPQSRYSRPIWLGGLPITWDKLT
jgi:hypothetical protein